MGELFTQLSTLVLQQSETLARIEDDVEIGLEETTKVSPHIYIHIYITPILCMSRRMSICRNSTRSVRATEA